MKAIKFMDFLLEQVALFPKFDFSAATEESASRSYYRMLQTYTAFHVLNGIAGSPDYRKWADELQVEIIIWQRISADYADTVLRLTDASKFEKLKKIIAHYRENYAGSETAQATTPKAVASGGISDELKEVVGGFDAADAEQAEAEAALLQKKKGGKAVQKGNVNAETTNAETTSAESAQNTAAATAAQ